jgi:hypothetical protein
MMAETAFRIAYDGPALETGRMPVRDLAPALLALGELFAEASEVIYPEGGPVALNIKATEQGSFDVQLILEAKDLWDQFTDMFGSEDVTALVNLKTLVAGGLGVGSLFGLIKWLKGRRVVREEPTLEPGTVRITVDDETSVEIPSDVAKLYRRITIRRKAREVVAPLHRDGVDEVKFAEEPEAPPELVIREDDLPAYESAATEEDDVLLEEERVMLLQIAAVYFEEGKKWRLSDGTVTFWASMEDALFLAEVDRRIEQFAKGDMLRCRLRLIQRRRPTGGLQTEYHVVQVLEHIRADEQMSLGDDVSAA